MKTDTTSTSVFWNEATLPNEDMKLVYKLILRYEAILITKEAVARSKIKETVHKDVMKFSDIWTSTPYTFTILTTTNDQAWDPPIFHEVKTKKGTFNFKVINFKTEINALICVVDFSLYVCEKQMHPILANSKNGQDHKDKY